MKKRKIFFLFLLFLCLFMVGCGETKIEYAIVRFETNGGSAISSITIEKGKQYLVTNTTTKEGSTFDGWFLDKELSTPYSPDTLITTTTTLYAKWILNQYNITFYSDSSMEESQKKTYYFGDMIEYPEFKKEGYRIDSWWIDDETSGDFLTMPAQDLEVYATWTLNTYRISFVTNTEEEAEEKEVKSGDSIPLPTLQKTGYTLKAWYLDSAFSNMLQTQVMPAMDITLYAKWEINQHTLTFITSSEDEVIEKKNYNYDEKIVVPLNVNKTGYQFVGWYIDEGLTQAFSYTSMPDSDLTLYAKYTVREYNLTYVVNSEETKYICAYNSSIPSLSKKVEGYHLVFKTEDGQIFSSSLMPNHDLVLYGEYVISNYNIHYHLDEMVSVSIEYGQTIEYLIPSKEGYTLDGWYLDDTYTTLTAYVTMPSEDLNLYPKWEINRYLVEYDLSRASLDNLKETINHGSEITLNEKTIEGYTFLGWYLDDSYTKKVDTNSKVTVTSNLIFYADYSINSYKLTYMVDSTKEVHENTEYQSLLPSLNYLKEGYSVRNWYLDSSYTTLFESEKMPSKDLVLYGKYEKDIYEVTLDDSLETTITFNLNYACDNPIYRILRVKSIDLEEIIASPLRNGYIFMGWYETSDCSGSLYDFSASFNRNFTLYAKWQENTLDATIIQESSVINVSKTKEEKYFAFVPSYNGVYSFNSISNHDLVGKLYDSSMNFVVMDDDSGAGSNFIFSATLKRGQVYYLLVDSFSGEREVEYELKVERIETTDKKRNTFEVSYLEDFQASSYVPEKNGAIFKGFYTLKNGEGEKVIDESGHPLSTYQYTKSITLYAYFEWIDYHLQIYDGDVITKDTTYHYLENYLYEPVKEGYTFIGFYYDSALTNQATSFIMGEEDVVLYMKWQINTYRLTKVDGITLEEKTTDYLYDETLSLLNIEKEGYTFMGYFTDPTFETRNELVKMPSRNVTLYLKYQVIEYTISYVTNTSEVVADKVVAFDEPFIYPDIKVVGKSVNWYLDDTFTTPSEYTKMPSKNVTIYAKWEKVLYSISFDYTNTTLDYYYDDDITLPTSPSKEGHSFVGFYLDVNLTEPFNILKMPDHNLQVYSKWTKNTYVVAVMENNGKASYNLSFEYGANILLQSPTKDGYTFSRWNQDSTLLTAFSYTTMPAKNLEVYASYKANEYTVNLGVIHHYTVTYKMNDGTTNNYQVTDIEEWHYLDFPLKPLRTGYVFKGWYLKDTIYDFLEPVQSDLTLLAGWEANTSYPVLNVGTLSFSTSSFITYMFVPSETSSYTFYTAALSGSQQSKIVLQNAARAEISSAIGSNSGNVNASLSMTLTKGNVYYVVVSSRYYPDYSSLYKISGSLIVQGKSTPDVNDNSTCIDRTIQVTYDTSYTLTPINKEGYIFNGWYTEENGGGTQLTDNLGQSLSSWHIDKDTTVYAYYTVE